MATVSFLYKGKKTFSTLQVRLRSGRDIDLSFTTQLVIPKKNWDVKRQRVKHTNDFPQANQFNESILKMEAHLLSEFSIAYSNGIEICSDWLRVSVLTFFNRPLYEINKQKQEAKETYLADYSRYFCDEIIANDKWKNLKTKKPISYKSAQAYNTTLNLIERYDKENKTHTKLKDVSLDWCEEFCNWMSANPNNYRTNYTSKNIGRIKFFCLRAEEDSIEVNSDYKNRSFNAPTEQTISTYLNEKELQQLFDQEYVDPKYETVRDWLIIGCYTGLRISDFLSRLKTENIEGDFIHLVTKKTGERVTIPIHNKIRLILDKRDGQLPQKYSDQKFNLYIKDACRLANIDSEIYCDIFDAETGRKQKGIAPKYLAVSSHICRRSFATNHYGKLPTSVIMAIGGWRTESSFTKYLRKSNAEHAIEMKKYWNTITD